jgi:hypothetical protein
MSKVTEFKVFSVEAGQETLDINYREVLEL